MSTLASIGVNDNLSTCQASISVRTTDYELACRVNEVFDIVVEQSQHFVANLSLNSWYKNVDNIFANFCEHSFVVIVAGSILYEIVVLGAYYDSVDTLRYTIVAIFYSNLALRVWTKISHLLALLADVGKSLHDELCKVEAYRHVVLSFVTSVTKHHTLVASTLVLVFFALNATIDVVALLMNGCENTT